MIGRSAGEIAGGMMRPSDRFAVTQVPLDRLHLTALSGAFSREGSALKRELRMVRAALLCADDVTFSSQVPELMAQQAWMESLTEKTWFEAIDLPWDSGIDWLTGLEQHAEVRAMRRVQADAPAMKRMSAVLKLADLDVLDGEIAQMEQELADLRRLEATGIVRYMPVPAGWPADEQAILNIDRVEEVMKAASHGTTVPLLDDDAWEWARTLDPGLRRRAQQPMDHAGLAARLVATVEGYADADIDVLIDARDRLRPHLAAFRASVLALAGSLPSRSDPGFELALREAYMREVAPALRELEGALDSSGARQWLRGGLLAAASGVPSALALVVGLPELVPVLGPAGGFVAGRMSSRHQTKEKSESNAVLWLWEAKRLLAPQAIRRGGLG